MSELQIEAKADEVGFDAGRLTASTSTSPAMSTMGACRGG